MVMTLDTARNPTAAVSLQRSGYARRSSFLASERPATARRSRESSLGVSTAAGSAGPRPPASLRALATPAGPRGSPTRGKAAAPARASSPHLQAPWCRAPGPRSRTRPDPLPGPAEPPPGQLLVQRRGPCTTAAFSRSHGPRLQGRASSRPVGRGSEKRAAAGRLTSSHSGPAGRPRMAQCPTRASQARSPCPERSRPEDPPGPAQRRA